MSIAMKFILLAGISAAMGLALRRMGYPPWSYQFWVVTILYILGIIVTRREKKRER